MHKFYSILILTLFSFNAWASAQLKVSSLNIRWYGYQGKNPSIIEEDPSDKLRDPAIRSYLKRTIADSDLIIFQEIVDVRKFEKNVIDDSFNCRTYEHPTFYHQHVVLCYKKKWRFDIVPGDNNYKLESVAINGNKSRPALWGVLKTSSGKALAYVIGLHLKAYPKETDTRLKQTVALAKAVQKRPKGLPVIIAGDFNSHYSDLTGKKTNDDVLMDQIFKKYSPGLFQIYNRYPYTYRTTSKGHKLDRIWVSNDIKVRYSMTVYPPCHTKWKVGGGFDRLTYYNTFVSDHCPLSVKLVLP